MKKQNTAFLSLLLLLALQANAEDTGATAASSTSGSGSTSASASAQATSSSENGSGISDAVAQAMSAVLGDKKNPANAALSTLTGGSGVGPGGVGVEVGDVSIFEQMIAKATDTVNCTTATAKGKGAKAAVQEVYVGAGSSNVVVGQAGSCDDISQESLATTSKTTSKGEKGSSALGKAGETAKIIKTSHLPQHNLQFVSNYRHIQVPLKPGSFIFTFEPAEGKAKGRSVSVLSQIIPFTQAIANDEGLKYMPNHHVLLLWARVEPPYQRASKNSDDWAWKEVIAIAFANSELNKGKSIPIFGWGNGKITLRFDNNNAEVPLEDFIYVQANAAE